MRGLTLVVASADSARLQLALTLTAANAALGGRARLYFSEGAVAMLANADLTLARESGVELIACQTGLAASQVALPKDVEAGGPISLLADLGDDLLLAL